MQSVKRAPSLRAVPGYAAVISAPRRIDVRRVEFQAPVAGQVRVRIEGCGVCASNLELWRGKPWFKYPVEPGAPGHEAWGRIDAVGEGVTDHAVGERVALLSANAFAEYDFAKSTEVVRIPADGPFPAEPLGCAVNIFKRANIRSGETVAIVGTGFLGILVTQLAAHAGARVLALSHRRSSLKLARESGASETIEIHDKRQAELNVTELTGGYRCECVIEAAGKQESLDLATELTRERGRLVIAGYHQDGARQVNMQLWNWRGLDVINAHERDPNVYVAGMREAIAAIEAGALDPRPLYTHAFKLAELSQAFNALERSPEGFVKALITL
jgi:threonine dehydrogenase-like Zn-dependent dehydrogenase